MCGISGIIAFRENGKSAFNSIKEANSCLSFRGPDNEGFYYSPDVVFGHRRLSIIDVSEAGNQPMSEPSGRYTIIFNGEFFNFKEHRNDLVSRGEKFLTSSDTEVLLRLYMLEGPSFLDKINGFFALAIHDNVENTVFIARDRFGIKPLFYYSDQDKFLFASELKSLVRMGIPRVPDPVSLLNYFQLNYIPGPWSVFNDVRKIKPGHYMLITAGQTNASFEEIPYYRIPEFTSATSYPDYEIAKVKLRELLQKAVERRLISDVPLGAFLSGGIDSSVIVALAAGFTPHLNTFSIGYRDEPMYDETRYAEMVAERYKTNHRVFSLSNDDLFANLFKVLDYIDEPFADSSALAVNILSMHTRKHVTVALSGDGADELFGGYNKHRAEWMIRNRRIFTGTMRMVSPLLQSFGGGRNTPSANRMRQLHRYASGAALTPHDRYWRWCGFADEASACRMLRNNAGAVAYESRKREILKPLGSADTLNNVLNMDMHLVLPNDMLVKVDMMSMANSLEVRVPFLDFEVVNFASSLPPSYKVDRYSTKKILRETFRSDLPEALFTRKKHGFEVPLLKWLRKDLKSMINDDLLSEAFIKRQEIFDAGEISRLKNKLFSDSPGEIEARMWGLIVFQYWWKKFMD